MRSSRSRSTTCRWNRHPQLRLFLAGTRGDRKTVTTGRRFYPRLYAYEGIAIANFIVIYAIVARGNQYVLTTIPETFGSFIPTLTLYMLGGVGIRLLVAAYQSNWRVYLRAIWRRGWITDTIRLILGGSLMVHTYFWIKLMMPILHPRLFDAQLWEIDRAMFFGLSPNILFLNLFSQKSVLVAIDWSYARIFFASMTVAFAYFLSAPSRRLRAAFMTGNVFMWITGAWLYVAVPALGPAFRFPEVWFAYSDSLRLSQHFQQLLFQNLRRVVQFGQPGADRGPQLMYGIAAFPSLHVAFQVFAFLWMRRLWIYGQMVFGVFMLIIIIGSVVTGWHYLIDAVAGGLLAGAAYLLGTRLYEIRRWRRLVSSTRAA